MKYIGRFFTSYIGVLFASLFIEYFTGIANLESSALPNSRSILMVLPLVLCIGGGIGVAAIFFPAGGCFTAFISGAAFVIGLISIGVAAGFVATLGFFSYRDYAIGSAVGIFSGALLLALGHYWPILLARRTMHGRGERHE